MWAYSIAEIGNIDNFKYGTNIDEFMKFCEEENNPIIYFHNEKFDGEFIIYWLLKNGFEYIKDKKERRDKTFTTLITEMGQFFNIIIYFRVTKSKVKKVTIYDSLKILPFTVEKIAKSFNLPISKLEIDYNKPREKNHELTVMEIEYIKNDVQIVAMALDVLFKQKLTKMTQASNAMYDYKQILGNSRFEHFFPKLNKEIDEFIRKSYKGGFTYLNPEFKEKETGSGIVLDVNSLYPSVLADKPMPFGKPIYFKGKYEIDKDYNLYVQRFYCSFELKKNKIPTVQIKGTMSFIPNEYLESSNGKIVELTMTNIDLKLFLEHYDIYDEKYLDGYKFRSINGLFNDYIDKWIEVKIQSKKDGNSGLYTLAKLMLNALYGKFALNPKSILKYPYLENDIVKYKKHEEGEREPVYIPVGTFVTSYAREKTIRTSQAIKDYSIKNYNKDLYIYSDTDSIHTLLPIEECKKFCEIDDYKLGYWKHESSFDKGKFIRQKCYLEMIDNKLNITCSGMPQSCYENVTWETFKTGFTCGGKLTFKHIKGRCVVS